LKPGLRTYYGGSASDFRDYPRNKKAAGLTAGGFVVQSISADDAAEKAVMAADLLQQTAPFVGLFFKTVSL
jgi:hypothetical protein